MSINTHPEKIISDNPIEEFNHDLFDREKSVETFVQHVLNVDCSKGLVVGVYAPWGEGKTSYLNLAKSEFLKANIDVFAFNPWMYGDANQLVNRFFREIAGEMKLTTGMEKLGNLWKKYGDATITIASGVSTIFAAPIISSVLSTVRLFGRKIFSPKSTIQLRETVANSLSERNDPIIVVLDDVDRLSTPEIKDIFKLVRLTANFPNLIYILLFDRERVEKALQDEGITGKEYLDKIIQMPFVLPVVPRDVLKIQIQDEIEKAMQIMGHGDKLEASVMTDIYLEIIFPLIRNMRDVRRYVIAVRESLAALSDRIAVSDLLALEAARMFQPHSFKAILDFFEDITFAPASRSQEHGTEKYLPRRERIDQRMRELDSFSEHQRRVLESLLKRIFTNPFNNLSTTSEIDAEFMNKLLHEKRVAHRQIFCCYLERIDSFEIRDYYLAKQAVVRMNNFDKFQNFLYSLVEEERLGAISQLWLFTKLIQSDQVVSSIDTFLNLLPRLVFENEYDSDGLGFYIPLFIDKLLDTHVGDKQPDDQSEILKDLLGKIFGSVISISSRFILLEKIQSNFPSQFEAHHDALHRYQVMLYQETLNTSPDVLSKEFILARLYEFAKQRNESLDGTENLVIDNSPEITFAILFSSRSKGSKRSLDSSYDSKETGFTVGRLIQLFDDPEELKKRVRTMEENFKNVSTEFESLGCKPAIVNSILIDAKRMVTETSE